MLGWGTKEIVPINHIFGAYSIEKNTEPHANIFVGVQPNPEPT